MGRVITKSLALMLAVSGVFGACGGRALYDDSPQGAAGISASAGAQNVAGAVNASGASAAGSSSAGSSSTAGGAGAAPITGLRSCNNNQDCALLASGCCAACEPIAIEQLTAVNSAFVDQYHAMNCAQPISCGTCSADTSEYDETLKYFRAVCAVGQCAVVDVRGSALTACVMNADCTLRDGIECCPGCDGQGWVPVNNLATFCDTPSACPSCGSAPPTSLTTLCQSGECRFAPPLR